MKVIKPSENRRILLKGTTRKINSQERGFLTCLRPLTTVGLPLMKNVTAPLAKSVLSPFWLTVEIAATNRLIQKKLYGSKMKALIISNKKIEDIMKIVKSI